MVVKNWNSDLKNEEKYESMIEDKCLNLFKKGTFSEKYLKSIQERDLSTAYEKNSSGGWC